MPGFASHSSEAICAPRPGIRTRPIRTRRCRASGRAFARGNANAEWRIRRRFGGVAIGAQPREHLVARGLQRVDAQIDRRARLSACISASSSSPKRSRKSGFEEGREFAPHMKRRLARRRCGDGGALFARERGRPIAAPANSVSMSSALRLPPAPTRSPARAMSRCPCARQTRRDGEDLEHALATRAARSFDPA